MSHLNELIDFIRRSSVSYLAVESVREELVKEGFTQVYENQPESYSDGGKHFVIRSDSSLIAFKGKTDKGGFNICAAHTDSPCFKMKDELNSASYTKLATEKYGGMIHYTWLDRPLSVAGRVVLKQADGISVKLVDLKRPVVTIPSVAIHLNRGVNDGYKFNPATDLIPLAGLSGAKGELLGLIADAVGANREDIISHDLFIYNAEEGRAVGVNNELVLAPRIDDLGCVYSALRAFIDAPETDKSVAVLALFDNEEVGSETKQGACSTFLDMTLKNIAGSENKYSAMLYHSFMVSADNAHALHPNHPELSDATNAPVLGKGVVVKYNANQRYTTDAVSDGIFSTLAARAGVSLQRYSNRADMLGGSTLGSIANTRVSVSTVDIGLPQLAMHSATETAAVSDLEDMIKVLTELYSTGIEKCGNDVKM